MELDKLIRIGDSIEILSKWTESHVDLIIHELTGHVLSKEEADVLIAYFQDETDL